jgi:hypothetical protein
MSSVLLCQLEHVRLKRCLYLAHTFEYINYTTDTGAACFMIKTMLTILNEQQKHLQTQYCQVQHHSIAALNTCKKRAQTRLHKTAVRFIVARYDLFCFPPVSFGTSSTRGRHLGFGAFTERLKQVHCDAALPLRVLF